MRSENEEKAISFAQEIIDKFEIFDRCITNLALDEAGIDILLVKKLSDSKPFRLHLQHKSSKIGAQSFRKHNPCIPVWIINKATKPHEAFTSLLNIAVAKASEQQSHYAGFFLDKLEEINKLYKASYEF